MKYLVVVMSSQQVVSSRWRKFMFSLPVAIALLLSLVVLLLSLSILQHQLLLIWENSRQLFVSFLILILLLLGLLIYQYVLSSAQYINPQLFLVQPLHLPQLTTHLSYLSFSKFGLILICFSNVTSYFFCHSSLNSPIYLNYKWI